MHVRPLKPEDMPQIVDLLETRDGYDRARAEKRAAIMEWIAFHNPQARADEARYFAVEDGGKVIAIHGRMPSVFNVKGQYVRGYFVHDLYVHREYREKGRGFWLTMSLAKAIEEGTDSFFGLFGMTPLNLEMQRRRQYHEMFADTYYKILRPEDALGEKIRNRTLVRVLSPCVRAGLVIADGLLLPRAASAQVVRVREFDRRFDDFFRKVSPTLGVCSVKDGAYLDWKYGKGPSRQDAVLAAMRGSEITGVVVAGHAPPKRTVPVGTIRDIIVDPDDRATVDLLLAEAIRYLKGLGVHWIRCVLSDERFAPALKRFLFIRQPGTEAFFVGNLDKAPVDKSVLMDIRRWHMTLGESDIYMLSGGIPPDRGTERVETRGK